MDWDKLRSEWREATPEASMMAAEELRARDRSLWKQVRRRDLVETVAAVIVVVFFSLVVIGALAEGEWLQVASALLIASWGAWLPFKLRQARRAAEPDRPGAPTLDYLRQQRDASLLQARMLERVWLWYLTPPAIGIIGLRLAQDGPTAGSLAYFGVMLVLYVGLAWLNRWTARTRFRAHADVLQRQIDELTANGG